MMCVAPLVSVLVVKVAVPSLSTAEPNSPNVSQKVAVPAGVPVAGLTAATVAVKVIGSP